MNIPDKCKILVIGNGGREHAIVKSIKKSPNYGEIFCASGNGGIAQDAKCVRLNGVAETVEFCLGEKIDLVIIGPEQPLVDGVSDALRANGILCFAPSQAASQLESSKHFTKLICDSANIPTAAYQHFTEIEAAISYARQITPPIVIKADGLAAGKGVVICESHLQAEQAIKEMLNGKFGEASQKIVIEEFLDGEELSFFAICNGDSAQPFGSAQDHKRAFDGDKGPNTGGMGTYSPAPIMNDALEQKIMSKIINPTIAEMARRGIPYSGILFAGLMVKNGEPKLIEFNTRLGDPETQVILPRLNEDFLHICFNAAQGFLPQQPIKFLDNAAICVVMASAGYPNDYQTGFIINGLDEANAEDNVTIFHAGTSAQNGNILTSGGRVLGVSATANSLKNAAELAYQAVAKISWNGAFYRKDIGWRALD